MKSNANKTMKKWKRVVIGVLALRAPLPSWLYNSRQEIRR